MNEYKRRLVTLGVVAKRFGCDRWLAQYLIKHADKVLRRPYFAELTEQARVDMIERYRAQHQWSLGVLESHVRLVVQPWRNRFELEGLRLHCEWVRLPRHNSPWRRRWYWLS